jgi:hypothetical protein
LALPLMPESLMPSSAGVDEHDDIVAAEEDTSVETANGLSGAGTRGIFLTLARRSQTTGAAP